MIITELKEQERSAWDNYVANSPDGLPFHLSGWKDVLSRTYGYDTLYLMAKEEGRVVGVLPVFALRSVVSGRALTTPPCGLCADSAPVALALLEEGQAAARQMKVNSLVLHDTRRDWGANLTTSELHVAWLTDLCRDVDAQWKAIDRNCRRQVRQAREHGLTVEIGASPRLVDDFYQIMSRFTREAGTPVFGRRFLRNVVEAFPNEVRIFGVYQGDQVVGSYLSMTIGKTNFGLWGASLHRYRSLRVSYLAYWEMLKNAIEMGLTRLDMGRSPAGSGASNFKSQWGGTSIPVYQQVAEVRGKRPTKAIAGRVRTDSRVQRFSWVWSRLPLAVTQFLGPQLRRHVPFA